MGRAHEEQWWEHSEFYDDSKNAKIRKRTKNAKILAKNGIKFRWANEGSAILIREKGFTIDFFPSTEKWVEQGKVTYGNAKDLVDYIKGQ
jgi:hypothetical protein